MEDYKPDILNCMANLSNDEVFTSPLIVNKMLDMLPEDLFKNTETTFLDPCCKTGVFLREITKRLLSGQIENYEKKLRKLNEDRDEIRKIINENEDRKEVDIDSLIDETEYPDSFHFLQELIPTINHIMTKQVFGIAITELTSLMSRRTLYCSKDANGKYSIVENKFNKTGNDGKIYYKKIDHDWSEPDKDGNCTCLKCGANSSVLGRDDSQESYAYPFIHMTIEEIMEDNMKFDVIVGNPPYQLNDGAGGNGSSAIPIYNKFIEKAIELNPNYISMIIPARWMTGGKGLDNFRNNMIHDKRIFELHDFPNSKDLFPGVDIKGGVCYFGWNKDHSNKCLCYRYDNAKTHKSVRFLCENGDDIFIREEILINIKNKIEIKKEPSLSLIVSARKPYGLAADTIKNTKKYDLPEFSETPIKNGYEILGLEGNKRCIRYIPEDYPLPKKDGLGKYKVFISKAYGCGNLGEVPSTPVLGTPVQLCTETFLQIGQFEEKSEAENLLKYIKSKFFRALVSIKKQTQNTSIKTYKYVPLQNFTNKSDIDWSTSIKNIDKQLYKKYNLTDDEIQFIEDNIKEMS